MINLNTFLEERKNKSPYNYKRIRELIQNGLSTKNISNFCSHLRQMQLTNIKIENCEKVILPENCNNLKDEIENNNFECVMLENKCLVSPKGWFPSFFENKESQVDITEEWMELKDQRKTFSCRSDPFIRNLFSYENYHSRAQREILIKQIFMKPGEVLIGNLPTGSGKSLLFQWPILKDKFYKGLTLVVVPTISLALDQERRINDLLKKNKITFNQRFAYYSGLNENERQIIKTNIRENRQGILFTSPEMVIDSLLPSLYRAVEGGSLRYFFIDEAHLLADWGDSFRTDYQKLAAVRNGLLEATKGQQFKTILLSATFNSVNLNLIDNLFRPIEKIHFLSSIMLRPEPKYYVAKFDSNEQKFTALINILNNVPRPCIIYFTEPDDAERCKDLIKKNGFDNTRSYTGKTSNNERENTQELWNEDELDFLVATSAFGVGVNKDNVRTVIHATVPETLERFYQEVGRAGRDGKNSNSILLYSDEDIEIAKKFAQGDPKDIAGSEIGFERWSMMKQSATRFNESYRTFDISKIRPTLVQSSKGNEKHNIQTLLLMARIGKIQLSKSPPPKQQDIWDKYNDQFLVNDFGIINFEEEEFKKLYQESRKLLSNDRVKSLNLFLKFLKKEDTIENCLEKVFNSDDNLKKIKVSKVSRGGSNFNTAKLREPVITKTNKIFFNPNKLKIKTNIIYLSEKVKSISDPLIFKILEIMNKQYNYRNILITKQSLDNEDLFFNKIRTKFSNNEFFINYVENFSSYDNINNIFFKIPTITLLFPWECRSVIPQNLKTDFANNFFIVPHNIFTGGNKLLKNVNLNIINAEKFIQMETF